MRYTRFVQLRRQEWDRFEHSLARLKSRPRELDHDDLEQLGIEYRAILHDQALAAQHYPGTGADEQLRRLAVAGTYLMQTSGSRDTPGFAHFWRRAFPRACRTLIPELLASTAIFLFAGLFAFVVTAVRPEIGLSFVGAESVDGLRRGDLWTDAIAESGQSTLIGSGIATNNMRVAITAWLGGIVGGLLTIFALLFNGVMLGAVLMLTWHYAMIGRLLEFIAAHGPLEITLILVCAAAGLSIGRSIIASGVVPRGERIRAAALRSVVVMVGCLPWFVLLGLVEAKVSPDPGLSVGLKIAVGLSLELLFVMVALRPLAPRGAFDEGNDDPRSLRFRRERT